MDRIGIYGAGAELLCRRLQQAGVLAQAADSRAQAMQWELLLLTEARPLPGTWVCRTLLLPEGAPVPCGTQQLISYGLSAKNSITLSSMEPQQELLCVQRALLRPDGSWVEPCDRPLAFPQLSTMQRLGLTGLLLLLEVSPEAEGELC